MKSMLKRMGAALAAKELYEMFQEKRRPQKSFAQRNAGKLALLGIAGGAFFLYRTGKLEPLIRQAKGMTRRAPEGESGVADLTGTPQAVFLDEEPEGATTSTDLQL